MKRWLKLEILPVILLLVLHAKVFAVAELTPLQMVLAAFAFLITPVMAGMFYGYAVGRGTPRKDDQVRWEIVDTSKGGA